MASSARTYVRQRWRRIRGHSLHLLLAAYFLVFALLAAAAIRLAPKRHGAPPLGFVDALFSAASAFTETGLTNVEMHTLSVPDRLVLLVLMAFGSTVFTSFLCIWFKRTRGHCPGFDGHAADCDAGPGVCDAGPGDGDGDACDGDACDGDACDGDAAGGDDWCSNLRIARSISMPVLPSRASASGFKSAIARYHIRTPPPPHHHPHVALPILLLHNAAPKDARRALAPPPADAADDADADDANADDAHDADDAHGADDADDALAHKLLMYTVLCYNAACITGGTLACQACIALSPDAARLLRARGLGSFFFSAFSVVSSFGNCGFILLDDNLVPLRRSALPLLCLNALMLLGGTLYAPALRLVIWLLRRGLSGMRKKRRRRAAAAAAAYERLLQGRHSLRFAHLFPAERTRALVLSAIAINAAQVTCMLGLDWSSGALRGAGGAGYKLLDALFQAIATRSSGMNVMDLALLSAPTLVLLCIFMYLKPYPIDGLTAPQRPPKDGSRNWPTPPSFPSHACLLIAATFLICVLERDRIRDDPINFSVFNIVFEVISAYGNVGLSIGYKCEWNPAPPAACVDPPYCLSRKWSSMGKLMLIFVMFLGKHRTVIKDVL